METKVIKEMSEVAFVLDSSDYNKSYDSLIVPWQELRKAKAGTEWEADFPHCGRNSYRESAKVVYKDNEGVAVLLRIDKSTDSPDPEYSHTLQIAWFAFDLSRYQKSRA